MSSLLITRGLHSLISSRDSPGNEAAAWNAITKRDSETQYILSSVLVFIWVLANILVLVPMIFVLVYTFGSIYPTLAIVENADSPPDYDLVAENEVDVNNNGIVDDSSNSKVTATKADNASNKIGSLVTLMQDETTSGETAGIPPTRTRPLTYSFVDTFRFLRSRGDGIFRAFRWRFASQMFQGTVLGVFSYIPYMPDFIAVLITSLAATKLETAWTHAVISTQRDKHLWKNLPNLFAIFKATAIPLIAQAIAIEVITTFAALPLGKRKGSWDSMGFIPKFDEMENSIRPLAALALFFALYSCLMVPTEVILTRIRAGMLADDANTLLVLDSTISSQNAEEIGYMSWIQSWRTFSRASWIRIVKINAKIFAGTVLVEFMVGTLIVIQVMAYFILVSPSTGRGSGK